MTVLICAENHFMFVYNHVCEVQNFLQTNQFEFPSHMQTLHSQDANTNVKNFNVLQIHHMKVCTRSLWSNFAYKVLDKHHMNPNTIRNT